MPLTLAYSIPIGIVSVVSGGSLGLPLFSGLCWLWLGLWRVVRW
ncbi:MAG: hypothetical protein AAFQ61_10915 [Cyanobacteria bacterium J06626_23]